MSWNRSSGKLKHPAPKPTLRRVVFVGALTVAIVLCTYILKFIITSEQNDVKMIDKTDAKPIKDFSSADFVKISSNVSTKVVTPAKIVKPPFVKRPGALLLPSGKVLTFPAPMEGHTRKVYADGRLYICDHLGNFTDITKRQLFHTAFEANFQALAIEGRTFIPAFLTGLDEEVVKGYLTKNYQPVGDETEEELKDLRAYDEMRCAALSYMEQGGKFDDFVNEFASFERKQRDSRAMTLREVMTLYKQGDIVGAKEMAEAASVLLERDGYKPLHLPPHVQEAFDAIE